jgi:RNA polymerase sigma-70 factor (ECF subfamily)
MTNETKVKVPGRINSGLRVQTGLRAGVRVGGGCRVDGHSGRGEPLPLPRLTRAFCEIWASASGSPSSIASSQSAEAERRLSAVVATAKQAHPGLAVDDLIFVRHLARCAAFLETAPIEAAESLAGADLFLACACALGVPGAAAAFDVRCDARLQSALSAVVKSDDLRSELAQHARDVLLVGGVKGEPKIAEYRGQGPLPRWVGVVVQGLAISALRVDQTERRTREAVALEMSPGTARPEFEYVKHHYRSAFEEALSEAIAALDSRSKMLLRLQFVRGVSVEKIGKMYGVSQSTASRWLADTRETIREGLDRLMRSHLDVSRDELASLAGLVASDLDLSMSRLLKATSGDQ